MKKILAIVLLIVMLLSSVQIFVYSKDSENDIVSADGKAKYFYTT